MIGLAALGLGAGAFFRIHAHGNRLHHMLASAAISGATTAGTEPGRPAERSAPGPPAGSRKPARDADVPALRAGEVLEYSADVSKLSNVASLRVQILDRRDFLGKSVWHLQASAHTENPLRMIFELDDQFDSYSDAATLCSLQYEMHLNERGDKADSVQRMITGGAEPAPANVTATRVLPGTRDPLGLLQYLRTVDWPQTREARSPVYDGHKLYDVRASLAAPSESVAVPAGNFTASKLDIRVFDNGAEMKDAHFSLYLAHNAARTPVLMEAVLPFATAQIELLRAR